MHAKTFCLQTSFDLAYLLQPPQQLDKIINHKSISPSMLKEMPLPQPKPLPQPQFCKRSNKKIKEQQSLLQPQSLPMSPQFEPPKKFICASLKFFLCTTFIFVQIYLHINNILNATKKCAKQINRIYFMLFNCIVNIIIFRFLFLF